MSGLLSLDACLRELRATTPPTRRAWLALRGGRIDHVVRVLAVGGAIGVGTIEHRGAVSSPVSVPLGERPTETLEVLLDGLRVGHLDAPPGAIALLSDADREWLGVRP